MNCEHGGDPRSCPTCAPALVERFKVIAEAFAIVRELGRCSHRSTILAGPYELCRGCGARRAIPRVAGAGLSPWRMPEVTIRAATLAARADLSNPFKAS